MGGSIIGGGDEDLWKKGGEEGQVRQEGERAQRVGAEDDIGTTTNISQAIQKS